jgi:hypothetical protein
MSPVIGDELGVIKGGEITTPIKFKSVVALWTCRIAVSDQ